METEAPTRPPSPVARMPVPCYFRPGISRIRNTTPVSFPSN